MYFYSDNDKGEERHVSYFTAYW